MALHGSIKVNHNQIGYWVARRTEEITDPNRYMTYECSLQVGVDPPKEFNVQHLPRDGAVRLAAKVLAVGMTIP